MTKDLKHLIAKAISINSAISEKDIVDAYNKLQSWDQVIIVIGLSRMTGNTPEFLLRSAIEEKNLL